MIGQYQMLVTDACSGLNSCTVSPRWGSVPVPDRPGTPLRCAALLASIAPIALVANVARVLILTLITFYLGRRRARVSCTVSRG